MAQFWNCLFNCLPRGQRTEPSHFLTFCPLFHQLMRSKRVVSEGDLEIGHLSRESYYTSIQSLFSQHFFSFVLPSAIFFAVPLLSLPPVLWASDVTDADVTSPFNCAIWWSWHLKDEGSLGFGMVSCPGEGKRTRASSRRESNRRVWGVASWVSLACHELGSGLFSAPQCLFCCLWSNLAGSGAPTVCLPCCPSIHSLECSV